MQALAEKKIKQLVAGPPSRRVLIDYFAVHKFAGTPEPAHAAFFALMTMFPNTAENYFNAAPAVLIENGITRRGCADGTLPAVQSDMQAWYRSRFLRAVWTSVLAE